MSTTPRTDAQCCLVGEYEDIEQVVPADFARTIEKELAEAKEWEKKFKNLHSQLMRELRDPNGTIWECAKKLQQERDQLRAEVEHYKAVRLPIGLEGRINVPLNQWKELRARVAELEQALFIANGKVELAASLDPQDKARLDWLSDNLSYIMLAGQHAMYLMKNGGNGWDELKLRAAIDAAMKGAQ